MKALLQRGPDAGVSVGVRSGSIRKGLFVFLVLVSLSGCTYYFFKPTRQFIDDPATQQHSPEDVSFKSSDGLALDGWYFKARGEERGTILVCHGNVENISTHVKLDLWLIDAGYNLFIFDYRGYGRSEGETTVEGVHLDAEAALDKLLTLPGVHDRIIIYGKSLGGAVAIHLAATTSHRDRIKGLIIESAFADYRMMARREIAKTIAGWPMQYPLSLLVNNDCSPLKFIKKVSPIPVLIMHGTADAIVPVEHGRLLFDAALAPKEYWELPSLGHVKSWTDEATRMRLLAYLAALPETR